MVNERLKPINIRSLGGDSVKDMQGSIESHVVRRCRKISEVESETQSINGTVESDSDKLLSI